jgi:hypothetical protein
MYRLCLGALLVVAACDSVDDRPLEVEYLTQAIFAPTCAAAQCHSSFVQAGHMALDTPDGVRRALIGKGLVLLNSTPQYDPDDPAHAALIIWLTEVDPFERGIGRMPYDAPMPNKDLYLLEEWISEATPGAQCNPEANNGMACNDREVVRCNADWSFGDRLMNCTGDCVEGTCK